MLESVIKWRPPRAPIYLFTQQVRGMGMSLYNYVRCELTRGHGLKDGQGLFSEKQRRVTRFMKTPRELEKLMLFGFLIMLDAFLFVFTWLPLRALLSLTVYTARLLSCCRQKVLDCGQKIDIYESH